ncbi:MAG: SusD/RagB family nutrient-binding outer membrane lipoprotein [Ferruginibacter sp.]
MKSINKNLVKITGFLSLMLLQLSCQKDSFTKANINQNAPDVVVPANILPAVENAIAYTQGGDLTRFSCLFMQQNVGFSRQAQAYYGYVLTSTDFDSPWGNMYTSVMGNNKDLMQKADTGGYNIYGGISRILMAYSLQLLVDEWGKVPYSQALNGAANTHPVYDDDKALYDTITSLINVAIQQLNSSSPGGQTPGADDLIYGGDPSKWIKFGHAIKARLFIHQSKGDPIMAANALAEANLAFTDNADNARFVYGSAETFANPTYEFNEQRADIDYGAGTLVDTLIALNDPRLAILTDTSYGDVNGVGIGAYYGNINAPVEFITYDEMLFTKAEATLRSTGNNVAAQGFYQAAILQNMKKLGVSDADAAGYIATHGTLPTSVNGAIAMVAFQEYVALYLNPEAWTLWRRTGVPNLTPVAGTNGIPRRYFYPQNEYSLNAANVPVSTTLYSPTVFWDK